jgi:hypothetical protein
MPEGLWARRSPEVAKHTTAKQTTLVAGKSLKNVLRGLDKKESPIEAGVQAHLYQW